MRVESGDLESMERDSDRFIQVFSSFAKDALAQTRLYPRLSQQRVLEAHGAWKNDLDRIGENERHLREGLDHFKRCGHLAFWLRRMSPVVEAIDLTAEIADSPGYGLSQEEKDFRELLFGYHNEYLAFDFGFMFCRYYELAKEGGSARAKSLMLDDDYFKTICHFMKYKNLSPHAMSLVYKSLFVP